MNDDLSAIFDPADGFSVAALVDGVREVNGDFQLSYIDAAGVASNAPAFVCASDALAGLGNGTALHVNATDYRISGIEHDGAGVAVVRLVRV